MGITPARAGTTFLFPPCCTVAWDHPRSRGNNSAALRLTEANRGSPPLAREQLTCIIRLRNNGGITPARAGTTAFWFFCWRGFQDHPRSRGNNQRPILKLGRIRGSPPLAREQPQLIIVTIAIPRITPARAGTTSMQIPHDHAGQDHPRSRGNNCKRGLQGQNS